MNAEQQGSHAVHNERISEHGAGKASPIRALRFHTKKPKRLLVITEREATDANGSAVQLGTSPKCKRTCQVS